MYCTPTFVLPSFTSVAALKFFVTDVASVPSTYTFILLVANVVALKYLSVPFIVITTLLFVWSIVGEPTNLHCGFIKSTKSPVIVVSTFPLFDVSFVAFATIFIDTVPLHSLYSLFV